MDDDGNGSGEWFIPGRDVLRYVASKTPGGCPRVRRSSLGEGQRYILAQEGYRPGIDGNVFAWVLKQADEWRKDVALDTPPEMRARLRRL